MTHNTPAKIEAGSLAPTATGQTPAPRADGRHYMDAKAANTRTAYRQAIRDFADALGIAETALSPRAITDAALQAYILRRAEAHKPATLKARVSILRQLATDSGEPVAGDQHRDALKAVTRAKGARQKQAKGFSLAAYHRAIALCGDDMQGRRDAALLALAYCTAARAAELVGFAFEDVDAEAGLILLRRSKTDQDGKGAEKHLSPEAVAAIDAWRTASGLDDGPILRAVNKGGAVGAPLTTRGLAKIVKRLLGEDYSPHSVRVGFVQSAVAKGCSIPEISLTTGQSPQTIQRYYAKADQKRSAAAKMLG